MKSKAIQKLPIKTTNKENTDDNCIDLTNGSSPTPLTSSILIPTPLTQSVLPVSTSQKSVLRKWHVFIYFNYLKKLFKNIFLI